MVSITRRGPTSGSGSGFGCSAGARVGSVVRAVSAGCRVVVFGVRAVVPTLRGGALRERAARDGVDGLGVSAVPAGFSAGVDDSIGFASGVGSGVGVAATSVGGGSGSLIVAPAEFTRFVLRPPTAGGSVFDSDGVSFSAISGPPTIGSNEPPKNK